MSIPDKRLIRADQTENQVERIGIVTRAVGLSCFLLAILVWRVTTTNSYIDKELPAHLPEVNAAVAYLQTAFLLEYVSIAGAGIGLAVVVLFLPRWIIGRVKRIGWVRETMYPKGVDLDLRLRYVKKEVGSRRTRFLVAVFGGIFIVVLGLIARQGFAGNIELVPRTVHIIIAPVAVLGAMWVAYSEFSMIRFARKLPMPLYKWARIRMVYRAGLEVMGIGIWLTLALVVLHSFQPVVTWIDSNIGGLRIEYALAQRITWNDSGQAHTESLTLEATFPSYAYKIRHLREQIVEGARLDYLLNPFYTWVTVLIAYLTFAGVAVPLIAIGSVRRGSIYLAVSILVSVLPVLGMSSPEIGTPLLLALVLSASMGISASMAMELLTVIPSGTRRY